MKKFALNFFTRKCFSPKRESQLLLITSAMQLMSFGLNLQAQVLQCGMSPDGVVLHYEGPLPIAEIQVFKDGKALESLTLNKSDKEILRELREAEKNRIASPRIPDTLTRHLLKTIHEAKHTNSIYGNYLLTVMQAVGLAVVDRKGLASSQYTAKIGDSTIPVQWIRKDTQFTEPAIMPGHSRSWYGRIESFWILNPANKIMYTKLFRKDHDSLSFNLVAGATFNTLKKGDTLFVMALDTTLPKLSYFQYRMIGYDFYGNPSLLSPELIADNLDNSTLPVVNQFTATEQTDRNRIVLKWQISHSERVKSVWIYRSFKSDKNFSKVSQVSARDSVYYDLVVNPMEAVYYKLVLYDLKGVLDNTPVVPVVSKQKTEVLPPADVRVELKKGQPCILWTRKDYASRGFYVYRTETIGSEPVRVSAFVYADTATQYQWTDTSAFLRQGKTYHYAVLADSRSYQKSNFSDFVSIQMPVSKNLRTPYGLLTRKLNEKQILLVWNTQGTEGDFPEVFNVYRAPAPDGTYIKVNKELLFMENSFVDSVQTPYDSLFYAVCSVAPDGTESHRSAPAKVSGSMVPWGIRGIRIIPSQESCQIVWPSGDPDVFQVEVQRLDELENMQTFERIPAQSGSYSDKSIQAGKGYAYRIISIKLNGDRSEPSEWVLIRP